MPGTPGSHSQPLPDIAIFATPPVIHEAVLPTKAAKDKHHDLIGIHHGSMTTSRRELWGAWRDPVPAAAVVLTHPHIIEVAIAATSAHICSGSTDNKNLLFGVEHRGMSISGAEP